MKSADLCADGFQLAALCRLGGFGVDKLEMARVPDLVVFAKEHGLKFISIADLIRYRRRRRGDRPGLRDPRRHHPLRVRVSPAP